MKKDSPLFNIDVRRMSCSKPDIVNKINITLVDIENIGDVRFELQLGQIGHKWDKSGTFSD